MISKTMLDDAKKAGGSVKKKRALKKPDAKQAPVGNQSVPVKDHAPELERLRAEISELRATLEAERAARQASSDELSRIMSMMSENKPFRIKPMRNMNKSDPDYLLVTHYDFVPVTYSRKLDS